MSLGRLDGRQSESRHPLLFLKRLEINHSGRTLVGDTINTSQKSS